MNWLMLLTNEETILFLFSKRDPFVQGYLHHGHVKILKKCHSNQKCQLSDTFKEFFRSILFSANSIFPFSTNSIFLYLKFLHFSGSFSQTTKSFQNGVSQKFKSVDDSNLLDGFSLVNLNGENDDDDDDDDDDDNLVSRQMQLW